MIWFVIRGKKRELRLKWLSNNKGSAKLKSSGINLKERFTIIEI